MEPGIRRIRSVQAAAFQLEQVKRVIDDIRRLLRESDAIAHLRADFLLSSLGIYVGLNPVDERHAQAVWLEVQRATEEAAARETRRAGGRPEGR